CSDNAVIGPEEVDLLRGKQEEAIPFAPDRNLPQRRRRVFDERGETVPFGGVLRFKAINPVRTIDDLRESFGFNRFQQVGNGIRLKSCERVLVVAGDENDQRERNLFRQRLQHLKAVQARHLNVEKDQVGLEACDLLQRFKSVVGFANYAYERG